MDFAQFAWRDGILLLAVVAGVYLALTLLRLLTVGQRKGAALRHAASELAAANDGVAVPGAAAADEPLYEFPFTPTPARARPEAFVVERPAADANPNAPAAFADALNASRLEQEVRDLRAEVAALRDELTELQASRRVSPQYADAMALAQRGFDAQGIADHCGISRGEAELVMSLARGVYANDGMNVEDDYVGTQHRGIAAGR